MTGTHATSGLETLSISHCAYITDKGFRELLPHPSLLHLCVCRCPGVMEDGLREIAALKSGCCRRLEAAR
jgi:hypothetical protein